MRRKRSEMIPAVTLHQPWASLIAHRIKTIETRSWRTQHRGRLAIHAAVRLPPFGLQLGPWTVTDIGRWVAHDVDRPGSAFALPLGAIIATVVLDDCVPMVTDPRTVNGPCLHLDHGALILYSRNGDAADVTDQAPYGHYAAGRWAWILTSATHTAPIPTAGQRRLWQWNNAALTDDNRPDDRLLQPDRPW